MLAQLEDEPSGPGRQAAYESCAMEGAMPPRRLHHDHMSYLTAENGMHPTWWEASSPFLAEFFGVFVVAMTFICNFGNGNTFWSITSNAMTMLAVQYSISHISGGILNPSIAVALYLSARTRLATTLLLILVQILGASSAAVVHELVVPNTGKKEDLHFGPEPNVSASTAAVVEVMFTLMITFAFLCCSASRRNNPKGDPNGFCALAVACAYIAGGYGARSLSASVFNPAISLGFQIADRSASYALVLLVPQLLGGILATTAYRIVRPREFTAHAETDNVEDNEFLLHAETSAGVMSEFIGTFFILFTKSMARVGRSGAEPWAVGAATVSMVCSLRGVSGAYFNPAVTMSVSLAGYYEARRRCPGAKAVLYSGVQILAGLVSTSVFQTIHHGVNIPVRPPGVFKDKVLAPFLVEIAFTFFICYVVLTTSSARAVPIGRSTSRDNISGLSQGFAVCASSIATGHISGSVLNPAAALAFSGWNLIFGHLESAFCVYYVVFQLLGAALASGAFGLTHAHLVRAADAQDMEHGKEVIPKD